MNWFQKNFKTIIYIAFLVPILTVAGVSISHVTTWYGLSNPFSWSIYLSIGIEIAALASLAAISAKMGKTVYFPFGIVTLIQFIGNIFFAYQYIDITSDTFKDWMDMVNPVVSFLGVEEGDPIGHKRFLALFSGGMLPLISLSFLHMLVKFEEEGKEENNQIVQQNINIDELSIEAGKQEAELEKEKYSPTDEDLVRLEEELKRLNEQKFGALEGPTGTNGPDDSTLFGVEINQQKSGSIEEGDNNLNNPNLMNTQEIDKLTWKEKYFPNKKVLNYSRRDA